MSHLADWIRSGIVQWRDPRTKALRQRKRATRITTTWGALTGLGVLGTATEALSSQLATFGGITTIGLTALCGIGAIRAGIQRSRLHRLELPPTAVPQPALPPLNSLAREPMMRLGDAEKSLHELLAQMRVSSSVVAEARATAIESAAALRGVAGQIVAVERARDVAPSTARADLDEGLTTLRARLDQGVDGYRALVAAAGQTVIASSNSGPREALIDATDRLAGLASALRELSR